MKSAPAAPIKAFGRAFSVLCCGILGIVFPANADLVLNGSLENPVLIPSNSISATTPTSWSGGRFLINGFDNPGVYIGPQDGHQFEDLGNASSVVLAQALSVGSAGSYLLTWYDSTLLLAGAHAYTLNVSLAGSFTPTTAFSSIGGAWQSHSLMVTFDTPGSATLTFDVISSDGNNDVVLDNVTLTPVVVPEPTTLTAGAVLLPFGAAVVRAIRRKRAA